MTTLTDERTALSDRAVATLRTAVPTLWGLLVTTLLGALAGHLPDELYATVERVLASDVLLLLVVTAVVTAWYWLWRRVEDRVPLWLVRLVLGSARTPSYALGAIEGELVGDAYVITSLSQDERTNLAALAAALDEGDPGRAALERVLTT